MQSEPKSRSISTMCRFLVGFRQCLPSIPCERWALRHLNLLSAGRADTRAHAVSIGAFFAGQVGRTRCRQSP